MDIPLVGVMTINALSFGLMLMLMALGLTLIFGVMRIVNLAQGEFMMVGAYVVWFLFEHLKVNYWVSLLISMFAVAALGVIAERYLFRRFRAILLPSLVVSIGLTLILQSSASLVVGLEYKTVHKAIPGQISIEFLETTLSLERIIIGIISLGSVIGLILFLHRTRIGRAIRAVSEDQEGAALQGISMPTTTMLTMAIGSCLAGVGGGLMVPILNADPRMGFPIMLQALMAIVIGGMGSVGGALVASLGVGCIISFGTTLFGATVAESIIFVSVILLLLFRPRGLWGRMFH
jgi:branched-chain amino acid transport system permease protein